jgi:LmbE family N-acetylglucosaminyl deacetylase
MSPSKLDAQGLEILALAPHRDDVQQTPGGTLLKAAQNGQRTGMRWQRVGRPAKILGVGWICRTWSRRFRL